MATYYITLKSEQAGGTSRGKTVEAATFRIEEPLVIFETAEGEAAIPVYAVPLGSVISIELQKAKT